MPQNKIKLIIESKILLILVIASPFMPEAITNREEGKEGRG
jgi:hypothetical protein